MAVIVWLLAYKISPMKKYVIIVFAVAAGCSSEISESEKEGRYILSRKTEIRGSLKDPSSAEFRNVFVSRKGGAPVVCGEVNSKNSFGGYVGFQRFVSFGTINVIESQMAPGEMDATWMKICGR